MNKQFNKRIYNTRQFFKIMDKAMESIKDLKSAEKKGLISKEFKNRIMLAVTEVNGCELCSYHHTKEALKLGMSQDDISLMLNGNTDHVNNKEAIGIFFAQHYAETGGNPDNEAYKRLLEFYGEEKTLGIVGAIRLIMMGNAHGIAIGALKNRLKGNSVKKSNLASELGVILSPIFVPVLYVKNLKRFI